MQQDVDFRNGFAGALLRRDRTVPDGLHSWTGDQPVRRFNVYRNNVSAALVEALAVRYPVVQRLVGEEFFRAMAREYALANLPKSPVLIWYGDSFPAFIDGFEPAASLAYLGDVARLESAYWEAYHASDGTAFDVARLERLAPEELAAVRIVPHASVRLVASRFPVVTIWHTNTHDETVRPIYLDVAEDALVSRPGMSVEIRRLPPGAYAFLASLCGGEPLAQAAELGNGASPEFDLAGNIQALVTCGLIADVVTMEVER